MLEQMISTEHARGKVKLRLQFGDHLEKSPWISQQHAPSMLCRLLSGKILRLVKQRKYIIEKGMAIPPDGYQKAMMMLQYRLDSRKYWNCSKIKVILNAMLGDLRTVAPTSGKYADTWQHLIANVELLIQEEDIERKIKQLVHGS